MLFTWGDFAAYVITWTGKTIGYGSNNINPSQIAPEFICPNNWQPQIGDWVIIDSHYQGADYRDFSPCFYGNNIWGVRRVIKIENKKNHPSFTLGEWTLLGAQVPLGPAVALAFATMKNYNYSDNAMNALFVGLTTGAFVLGLPLTPVGAILGLTYGTYDNYLKPKNSEQKSIVNVANQGMFSPKKKGKVAETVVEDYKSTIKSNL